jgi:cytochrome P450
VHYCLGANLARAELAEALRALAGLGTITADGAARWRPALGITGPDYLPLRWSPRAIP